MGRNDPYPTGYTDEIARDYDADYSASLAYDEAREQACLDGEIGTAQSAFVLYQQKIHSEVNGDCLRAALATMMQWNPDELPNFVEDDDPWWLVYKTGLARGWGLYHEVPARAGERNQSPTGWTLATVPSIAFPGENHALVVDAATLDLVHDPNPPKWKRDGVDKASIMSCLIAVPAESLCDSQDNGTGVR